jgi:pimeloyl-ACP methyl ester carboxylesterase
MARLTQRKVSVNGVDCPVLEGGPAGSEGSEEAVVFVHGNPGSGRDWADLAAQVAPFARVVAPDMPGFGRAAKPRDFNYTVEGYAIHLSALLHQLGIRRVHLVLHDFGGPWGIVWGTLEPYHLASITLCNTGLLPGYRWHVMGRLWRTPVVGELLLATQTRSAFRLAMRLANPRGLPREMVDRMYDEMDAGTKHAIRRLYRATGDPGGPMNTVASSLLRPLDLPALVVWGARDPYIPVRYAEIQRETFRRAKVAVLPDSGHWPFADNPQAVAGLVVPFLREQIEPQRSDRPAAA